MTEFKSDQVTKLDAVPFEALDPCDGASKMRFMRFDYTQVAEGAIGTTIVLARLPAGKVRFLGHACNLRHSALGTSVTLDIGWKAHVDPAGDAVALDADGLDDGLDVAAAGSIVMGTVAAVLAEANAKIFESQEGLDIYCTIGVAVIPADATLNGHVAYCVE